MLAAPVTPRNPLLDHLGGTDAVARDDAALLADRERAAAEWRHGLLANIDREILSPAPDSPVASALASRLIRDPAQLDSVRRRGIVGAYLRLHNGGQKPVNKVHFGMLRDAVAKRDFEGRGIGDDAAFYAELEKSAQLRRDRTALPDSMVDWAMGSEISRTAGGEVKGFNDWLTWARSQPGFVPGLDFAYRDQYAQLEDRIRETIDPFRPQLAEVAANFEAGDPARKAFEIWKGLENDDRRDQFMDALSWWLRTYQADKERNFFGATAEATGQQVASIGRWLEFFLKKEKPGSTAPPGTRALDDPTLRYVPDEDFLSFHNFRTDLIRKHHEGFDRLKPTMFREGSAMGDLELGLQQAPGALTYTAMMAIPYVGIPLVYASMQGAAYDDLRRGLIDSGTDPKLAGELANTTAPWLAAIQLVPERIGFLSVTRTLPGANKILHAASLRLQNRLLRAVVAGGETVATEFVTEMGQGTAVEAAQELLTHLNPNAIKGPDWEKWRENLRSQSLQTFGATVLFGALGGVGGARQDAIARSIAETDPRTLRAMGVPEAQIEELKAGLAANNPGAMTAAARAARDALDPTSDTAAAAREELAQEEEKVAAARRSLAAAGVLPTITSTAEGFILTDPDTGAEVARASTPKQAAAMAIQHLTYKDAAASADVAALAEYVETMAFGAAATTAPGEPVVLDLHAFLTDTEAAAAGPAAEAALADELADLETATGAPPMAAIVLGSSEPEIRAGVRELVNRIYLGGSLFTVFHEDTERKLGKAWASGRLTREQTLRIIRAFDSLPGDRHTKAGRRLRLLKELDDAKVTDRMLGEAVAKLMESEFLRSTRGGRPSRGLLSRNLRAVAQVVGQETVTSFGAFLRAIRKMWELVFRRAILLDKALKQGVIKPQEWQDLLDALEGREEQSVVEETEADTATALALPAAPAFSLGEAPEVWHGFPPVQWLVNTNQLTTKGGKLIRVPDYNWPVNEDWYLAKGKGDATPEQRALAAWRLINRLLAAADPKQLAGVREFLSQHPHAVLLPVRGLEEPNKHSNLIPQNYARLLSLAGGNAVNETVRKVNTTHNTGKSALERLRQVHQFDGEIVPGTEYLIVDDVSTTGATAYYLSRYIASKGGSVAGIMQLGLTPRGKAERFKPKPFVGDEHVLEMQPATRKALLSKGDNATLNAVVRALGIAYDWRTLTDALARALAANWAEARRSATVPGSRPAKPGSIQTGRPGDSTSNRPVSGRLPAFPGEELTAPPSQGEFAFSLWDFAFSLPAEIHVALLDNRTPPAKVAGLAAGDEIVYAGTPRRIRSIREGAVVLHHATGEYLEGRTKGHREITFEDGLSVPLPEGIVVPMLARAGKALPEADRQARLQAFQPGGRFWKPYGPAFSLAPMPPGLAEQIGRERAAVEKIANDVERRLGFLPAPNGKRSNLTRAQWIDVRTPAFKEWFGDWESVAKATMPRSAITLDEAVAAAREGIVNRALRNERTGLEATLSSNTIGKIKSASAVKKSFSAQAHALALANVDHLFRHAEEIGDHPDKKKGPHIKRMIRFGAVMLFRDMPVAVKLTVKEFVEPADGTRIYSLEALDVKNEEPAGLLAPDASAVPDAPLAGSKRKLRELAAKVNPETVSKEVDENGEPLIDAAPAFSLAPAEMAERLGDIARRRIRDPLARAESFERIARTMGDLKRRFREITLELAGVVGVEPLDRPLSAAEITERVAEFRNSRMDELVLPVWEDFHAVLTDDDLTSLASQNLHSRIYDPAKRHGSIMSRTEARRRGLRPDQNGLYDGIDGLWTGIFGGSLEPDVAAMELGFDRVDDMWEALAKEQASVRRMKEHLESAKRQLKEAREQAYAEAREMRRRLEGKQEQAHSPRQRLLRAMGMLNGILRALPPEVRAKVGGFVPLASAATDEARMKILEGRIEKADAELEKWLREQFDREMRELLFERATPAKDEAGKKRLGKAGAEMHALFERLRGALVMTREAALARAEAIETELEEVEGLSLETQAALQYEAVLVPLAADWKNRNAADREAFVLGATRLWESGYYAHLAQLRERKERREDARGILAMLLPRRGTEPELARAKKATRSKWRMVKDIAFSGLSFDHLVSWIFGEDVLGTPAGPKRQGLLAARELVDRERTSAYLKADALRSIGDALDALFVQLAGDSLKGSKLRWKLSQKSHQIADPRTGEPIELSELEMITASLMWRQDDGRRHMEGHKDDVGNPIGRWHYNQSFIDEIEAKLSQAAKSVREFLSQRYAEEYNRVNAVYRRLYGINMPRIDGYAPISLEPSLKGTSSTLIDPISGMAVSGASFTPGSLRTRSQAITRPKFDDALQLYVGHTRQMEHFIAYAELAADMRQILAHADVRMAVGSSISLEAANVLSKWVDYFALGGVIDSANALLFNQAIGRMVNRAVSVALVGRASVLAVQFTQWLAGSAEMSGGAFWRRFAKLATGRLDYAAAFRSSYIQRRLREMPVIVQQMAAGLAAAEPSRAIYWQQRLGRLIGGMDAIATAGTYAIAYDWQLELARKPVSEGGIGLDGDAATAHARAAAERITDRVAQPMRPGSRSLLENMTSSPWARILWAFASDPRKNLGLLVYNLAKRPLGIKVNTMLFVWVFNGLLSQLMRAALRDARDDQDDEWFDKKHWDWGRLGMAAAIDPLHGVPLLGDSLQSWALGWGGYWAPEGTLLNNISNTHRAVRALPATLRGERSARQVLRDVDAMLSGAGMFSNELAAYASFSHLAKDLFEVTDAQAVEVSD